jgi:molecular chaperone GrpE
MSELAENRGDESGRPAASAEGEEIPLESQLEAAVADRDANYDRWLRSQAELENYRKRVQRDAEDSRRYQALPLVRNLLPTLDNLQRTIAAAQTSQNVDDLIAGVQLVVKQFTEQLAAISVTPIEAVGKPFDPHLHEAVGQAPSAEQPAMTVIQELEPGYLLHDRVVRPAKVLVSSGPPS